MKILTVDDSMIIRKIVSGVIEAAGYDPIAAKDGVEALSVLRSHHEDIALVVMDWNMPNKNGLEAIKEIRANGHDFPIVMVTTEAEKKRIVEAIQAGANNYVVKPFAPDVIIGKIKDTMNK